MDEGLALPVLVVLLGAEVLVDSTALQVAGLI